MIMTMIFSLKAWLCYGQLRCKWNGNLFGKAWTVLFPSFQTGFVVAPENLISEAKNYLQMLDRQGDLTQEQMLSELIYEGEIHRLLKKNILVYKQRRDFLYQCLEENFKDAIRFKTNGGLAIWLQFNTVIPCSTFRTSATL
jgi:GntR family transcriptional regulator/MocR family aminotransferase